MRIVVATTTGFHLRHLARELIVTGQKTRYFSYHPSCRIRAYGIPSTLGRSLFVKLQPWSSGALFRSIPSVQTRCVHRMLELTDRAIANELPPCDVFIGLSGMAVRSAKVARQKYGAKVFIDRGSRHVRSQNKLTSADGGVGLTEFYIQRELDSYAAADYIALPSSHAMKSFLEEGFAEKQLFVNSYGVDFTLFEPTPAPALPLKLLFVGGWSYQKGADILSAALSRLPNCTLTHAGTRVDVKYPSGQQFRALGHVPAHMLPAIFADHHILVLPSRQDGFGMVLLEAMASGLGVVASHITGGPDIRSVIERKVFVNLVRPGSVDDLVRGIRELECTLPRQGSDRAILSNTEKDYFSWRSYAQRYVEFMRSSIQDT